MRRKDDGYIYKHVQKSYEGQILFRVINIINLCE